MPVRKETTVHPLFNVIGWGVNKDKRAICKLYGFKGCKYSDDIKVKFIQIRIQ